jgi:hypothetical protein
MLMADTLIREGNPPAGKLASPTPQYDLTADGQGGKERVLGSHGAPRAQLYDKNGNPIDASNPLEARARQLETLLGALTDELVAAGAVGSVSAKLRRLTTDLGATLTRLGEAQDAPSVYTVLGRLKALESALAAVMGKQDAQQATLGTLATDAELAAAKGILSTLEGKDFATSTQQAQAKALLSTLSEKDYATDAKLEAARTLLATLSDKDFATQTTLEALATELAAAKAELETIKAAQIDGTAKVQLSGSKTRVSSPPVTGVKTVTGVAAELFAGASRKAGRSRLVLRNMHSSLRLRIGPPTVTDSTGFGVEPQAVVEIDIDPASDVPWYAISEAGAIQVEVLEA